MLCSPTSDCINIISCIWRSASPCYILPNWWQFFCRLYSRACSYPQFHQSAFIVENSNKSIFHLSDDTLSYFCLRWIQTSKVPSEWYILIVRWTQRSRREWISVLEVPCLGEWVHNLETKIRVVSRRSHLYLITVCVPYVLCELISFYYIDRRGVRLDGLDSIAEAIIILSVNLRKDSWL